MSNGEIHDELLSLGETVLNKAKKFGADEIELYLQKSYTANMRIITEYITTRTGLDVGVGIRVVVGKSVGFYSISTLEEDKILEGVKKAINIAKNKPADPKFKQLPDPVRGFGKKGPFDKNLASMDISELVNYSGEVIKRCYGEIEDIKKIDFSLTRTFGGFAVVNSRGINVGDSGTFLVAYCDVQLPPSKDNAKGIEVYIDRRWDEEKFFKLAEGSTKMARESIGGKKLEEPFEGQMLLANEAVSNYIVPLIYNISALNVQEGRSRFRESLGKKVASEKLTILDDGQIENGFRTALSDDEGIPMKTKSIIEGGVLKTFIYDSYTAYRENKESTGNGIRRGYSSEPSPSTTNIVIKGLTNKGLEDLISEVDKGVLVRGELMGAHLTDPIKGTFALTCLNALYIEGGEVKYPIKAVSTTGNFFEMINNIITIGSDYFTSWLGVFPTILVDKIHFA